MMAGRTCTLCARRRVTSFDDAATCLQPADDLNANCLREREKERDIQRELGISHHIHKQTSLEFKGCVQQLIRVFSSCSLMDAYVCITCIPGIRSRHCFLNALARESVGIFLHIPIVGAATKIELYAAVCVYNVSIELLLLLRWVTFLARETPLFSSLKSPRATISY